MFEKAIAKDGINTSESYMFGDKTSDIEAASKCGIHGIFIDSNENISKFCTDILAKTESL